MTDQKTNDLLPCPFCENLPEMDILPCGPYTDVMGYTCEGKGYYTISCKHGHAVRVSGSSKELAIAAWNTRSTPVTVPEEAETALKWLDQVPKSSQNFIADRIIRQALLQYHNPSAREKKLEELLRQVGMVYNCSNWVEDNISKVQEVNND